MLSSGLWHSRVPRKAQSNLRFRLSLLASCRNNRARQAAIIQACSEDIVFFAALFLWQFNPQKRGDEVGPFIPWEEFQDGAFREIVWCIEHGEDLVIEKSREMGASWMCLIVMLWHWLFHPWKKFLLISRNADAVDCEDSDSLFWKLDFMIRHLPGWMVPRLKRRSMFLGNEDNGSTITGTASTGKAGVGGRATAAFVDEFSQIREDREVLGRTADTTRCRIFNFTHTDIDTAAFELVQRPDIRKLRLHWSKHPDKNQGLYQYHEETGKVEVFDKTYHYPVDFQFVMDGKLRSPWYDKECLRRNARDVAIDLDINPQGAMSQFIDPNKIAQLIRQHASEPFWTGDLVYNADGVPEELVPREGGRIHLWVHLDAHGRPPRARYVAGVDCATGTGATPSVLSIANADTGEKVLEYADPTIEATPFSVLVVALCRLFQDATGNGARLVWETPGPGLIFGKRVLEMGYSNIYYRTVEMPHSTQIKVSDTPGWASNSQEGKRILLEEYRDALYARHFLNHSELALKEFLNFRYGKQGVVEHAGESGGKDPSSARVNHGDRVIADALCWKLCKGMGLGRTRRAGEGPAKAGSLGWRRELHEQRRRLEEAWS